MPTVRQKLHNSIVSCTRIMPWYLKFWLYHTIMKYWVPARNNHAIIQIVYWTMAFYVNCFVLNIVEGWKNAQSLYTPYVWSRLSNWKGMQIMLTMVIQKVMKGSHGRIGFYTLRFSSACSVAYYLGERMTHSFTQNCKVPCHHTHILSMWSHLQSPFMQGID